jgi:hypothetical protein
MNPTTLPTVPAGQSPEFNAGWQHACIACEAAWFPVPTPTPTPTPAPVPLLPLGSDLVAALNSAHDNAVITLEPGQWAMNGLPVVKANNVSLNLNGAVLAMFPPPDATSDIRVNGINFELHGGTIKRGVVCVRTYALGTYLHDLIVPDVNAAAGTGINTLLLCDIGGSDAKVDKVTCGLTNGVTVYWMADRIKITNSHFEGSIGEDCLRSDVDQNGRIPTGAIIQANYVGNDRNAYNKEAIAIRMGQATISGNKILPYMRAGQSKGTRAGTNASITVSGNVFPMPLDKDPHIAVKQGVSASIDHNTFVVDEGQTDITVDGNSSATLTGNVRQRTKAGITLKPMFAKAPNQNPDVTETGTSIVDPPAAQPAEHAPA